MLVVLLGACAGTEHPIFESVAVAPLEPIPMVKPPPKVDAGSENAGSTAVPPPAIPPTRDEDGGVEIDPGLDPTAKFPWTQSLPGAGTCKPGRYTGGFECTMPGTITGWPISIGGKVAFTLQGSAEAQMLVIEQGSLGGSFFDAPDMYGGLDCRSDDFAADASGMAVDFATGSFAARMEGAFDDQSLRIEGKFRMVNDLGEHCDGSFRVGIAP